MRRRTVSWSNIGLLTRPTPPAKAKSRQLSVNTMTVFTLKVRRRSGMWCRNSAMNGHSLSWPRRWRTIYMMGGTPAPTRIGRGPSPFLTAKGAASMRCGATLSLWTPFWQRPVMSISCPCR